MRWIDRGPDPDGVAGYARQFTQGWIDYFQHQIGGRPTDFYWREFRPALGSRSGNICWYCERQCEAASEISGRAATVDHFRPLSRFPELAYEWTNWVFSCRRCNEENKQDKWPDSGYVDPGEPEPTERPEQYFDYDAATGELFPKSGLTLAARNKALQTIDDLGLNQLDVRFYRLDWTRRFLSDFNKLPSTEQQAFADFSTRIGMEFAGASLMAVRRLLGDDDRHVES